jgi:hypothetical protein
MFLSLHANCHELVKVMHFVDVPKLLERDELGYFMCVPQSSCYEAVDVVFMHIWMAGNVRHVDLLAEQITLR